MNSRRVQSSISGLERDITNYEAFLSKVIKGKVDKPKFNACKPAQNVRKSSVRERAVMPLVAGPSVKVPTSPKIRSNPRNSISSSTANHVVCKEVFENNGATVEVTVKTKAANISKSRKRPRSNTLISVPQIDRPVTEDEIQKQSNVLFEPPDPSKLNRNIQHERQHHSHSKHRSLSWAHILKDKNTACIIHNAEPKDGDEIDHKELYANPRRSRRSSKRSNKYLVAEVSLSSSISDASSNDQETLHYIDRSVQCSFPEIKVLGDKQKDVAPSKLPSKHNSNSVGGGNFSMFSPVRTLNFLVKELRGKLLKSEEDENMQRIITDMEHALMHIPSEVNAYERDHTDDIPTRDETLTRPYKVGYVPIKPAETSRSKPVVLPRVKFTEQSSSRQFKRCLPPFHEQQRNQADLQSSISTQLAKEETTSGTQIVQRELEVKCARLECTCKELELTCEQLRKERDSLNEKVKSEKEELEVMAKKEKDYLVTISCLRPNLENMTKKAEEQAKALAELVASSAQLQEENKALLPLHDAKAVPARRLKESNKEEENIHAQLQIMKLECEKFEILLVSKDKELETLKQELRDIQAFASEQLSNLKSFATIYKTANEIDEGGLHTGKQFIYNNDSELDTLTTEITLFLEKAQTGGGKEMEKQPVCSSPTSSVPSSLGIYPSWQKISRISSSSHKDDVNKLSSKEVCVLPPTRKINLNESEDDSGIEGNRSFSFIKPKSPEFKSFLVDSLSENVAEESKSELSTIEPKTHKELKDELRSLFERIKKKTRMGTGVSLPSPPHHCAEISEPSGMSQWSEISDAESVQNSLFASTSSADLNKGKFDLSTSDTSFESKFEADK